MIDFEKSFSDFVNSSGNSAILDIYKIIPTLNQQQMMIIHTLRYFIKKHELQELDEFINSYLANLKVNKNLNFLSSMNMRNLLKSYTNEEMLRGYKINTTNVREE